MPGSGPAFHVECQAFADKLSNRLASTLKEIVLEELAVNQDLVDKVRTRDPIEVSACTRADESTPESSDTDDLGDESQWRPVDSTPTMIHMNSSDTSLTFNINLKDQDYVGKVTGEDIRAPEIMDVFQKFTYLDPKGTGLVSMEQLVEAHECGWSSSEAEARLESMRSSVVALNLVLKDKHKGDSTYMSLETFKVVMLADHKELVAQVGVDRTEGAMQIREMCIQDKLASKIAGLCHVSSKDLMEEVRRAESKRGKRERASRVLKASFEPMLSVVIVANAVILGLSLDIDPDWNGWIIVEFCFTSFFTIELIVRFTLDGCLGFFCGEDLFWNWFDFLIVVLALVDTSFTIADMVGEATNYNFSTFTLFRMTRLVRITRLLRLLRFKFLKELILMLKGAIGGMRTLFWAMLVLLVIIYALGVVLRQVMDPEHSTFDCSGIDSASSNLVDRSFQEYTKCNRGAWTLNAYGMLMFKNVPRAMLTAFLCLTEGCTAADGTPMVWHWWDSHGVVLVMAYCVVYVFVTFGMFNVILAIFVENILEFAHNNERLKTKRRHEDNLRRAQIVRKLIIKLLTIRDDKTMQSKTSVREVFHNISSKFYANASTELDEAHLSVRLSKEEFELAMQSKEIQALLDNLEVSCNYDQLFHILDADGNGFLAMSEIADGVMRMRGFADKGDIVSAVLMLRSLTKHVRRFEEATLYNQRALRKMLNELTERRTTVRSRAFSTRDGSADESAIKTADTMSPGRSVSFSPWGRDVVLL